jgi:hypothetical protein
MKTRTEQIAFLELVIGHDNTVRLIRELNKTGHLALLVCSDDDRPEVKALFEHVELLGGELSWKP